MIEPLEPLLDELARLTQAPKWEAFFSAFEEKISPLGESRKQLHAAVVATIHRIEDLLSNTLKDQPLKGSYNIFTSAMPLNAWNVRRQNKSDTLKFPRNDHHEPQALVLLPDGRFWVVKITSVRRVTGGYEQYQYLWECYEPLDEDFRVEDLRLCLETVVWACGQHLLKARVSEVATGKIRALSDAITDTLLDFSERFAER